VIPLHWQRLSVDCPTKMMSLGIRCRAIDLRQLVKLANRYFGIGPLQTSAGTLVSNQSVLLGRPATRSICCGKRLRRAASVSQLSDPRGCGSRPPVCHFWRGAWHAALPALYTWSSLDRGTTAAHPGTPGRGDCTPFLWQQIAAANEAMRLNRVRRSPGFCDRNKYRGCRKQRRELHAVPSCSARASVWP
jgi:hypothetical protein